MKVKFIDPKELGLSECKIANLSAHTLNDITNSLESKKWDLVDGDLSLYLVNLVDEYDTVGITSTGFEFSIVEGHMDGELLTYFTDEIIECIEDQIDNNCKLKSGDTLFLPKFVEMDRSELPEEILDNM